MPFEDLLQPQQIDPITGLNTSQGGFESLFSPSDFRAPQTTGAHLISKYDEDLKIFEDVNVERAKKQSSAEQFGNFLTQAVIGEIIGGTIEGIGFLGDLDDASKIIQGEEVELGNAVVDFGQSLRTWAQEIAPIYETAPGKFAPGNFSWWMSNGTSVASTIALMIPAAGTVKGISMLGKSMGIVANLSKTAKIAATGVSQAVVSRHIENLLEASGKYDELYERNLRNGYSDEESRKNASVAAADIYQKNWVMLAQDIPQYLLLGKSFGKASKAITPGVASELGQATGALRAKVAGRYFLDALSEGGEEAYQYVVSEKADDLAMAKLDPDYRPRQLQEFLKEDEFWTSTSMGMLGAGVFQAGGRAINKALGNVEEKQRIQNVRSYGPTIKYYSEMIKDAETRNDFEAYEEARLGMVNTLAGKASEFGNLDILVNNLEQVMSQEATPEALEKFGITAEDVETIKKDFPTFIEDVKEVGKAFEDYSTGKVDGKKYDSDIASQLAGLETSKRRLNNRKVELTSQLESGLGKLSEVGFNDLSYTGGQIVAIDSELKAHNQLIKYLKDALKNKDLVEENREYYSNSLKKQEDIVASLKNKKQELRKSDVYTKEDRASDAKINLDSSLLTDVNKINSKLKYTELALDKKDDTIKRVKETQSKRNKGEKPVPQEPEPPVEPEVAPEEPISEATHEATEKDPETTTTVETKKYVADPKDIARRRKKINVEGLTKANIEYGNLTLNELFEEYASADAANGDSYNTGLLQKEGDRIYFYGDNSNKKYDVTYSADEPIGKSSIFILGKPNEYKTEDPVKDAKEEVAKGLTENEAAAIQDPEPMVEHPDSDSEVEGKRIDEENKVDTGEIELVYLYNQEKELSNWLENPANDISRAIGTFSIDLGNITIQDDKKLLKALKTKNIDNLTQEMLDQVPISLTLDIAPGTIFVPRPSNVAEEQRAGIRATRTTIIESVLKEQKATIKGFRKDSGHKYFIPNEGARLNIIKSIDMPLSEVELGIAFREGSVQNRIDETLKIRGNPKGGNVYLYTNRTPNKEDRGIKLNKTKVTQEHANIILNAFEQSIKKGGFKQSYEGSEVEGSISLGELIGLLSYNGDRTIVTDKTRLLTDDKKYLDRLYANQLYKSKNYLYYGKEGKLNLNNIKPEDRDNFVQYAKENFNYPISRDKLSKTVPDIKVGTVQFEKDMTYEHMYVKNGWVTTDVVSDQYGNVIGKPQVYVNFSNETKIEVEEPVVDKPVDLSTITVDSVLNKYRPFTSKIYQGQRYLRDRVDNQIEQIRELINRDVPIEVTNDFIRVVGETESHLAFGQVKDGSIKLYENAEEGTGYHEAFHIVSLYYLTGRERKKVYDDASSYYNIDRGDERAIEERLAEDFREYMLSEKKVAPKQVTTRNFFQRLYDFIIDLFVNPETKVSDLTIEKLFNNIENGTYKEAKIRNKNRKKYDGYDYLRKIEGFSTEQVHNITNLLMYQMLTKNNVVKLEDINRLSLDPVVVYLRDLRDDVNKARLTPGIDNNIKQDLDRLYEVYSKVLTNFDQFANLLSDRLFAMNINRKPDAFEDTNGIDIHNIFVKDSGGSDLTKYDRASYESSGKDNLLANVKLFIATLPASGEIDPYTQMPKMTDFTESYSKLMKDLHDASTFEDIVKILEQKVEPKNYYDILLNGDKNGRVGLLNAPSSFKHQFEIAVYMHRHDFVNVVINKKGHHIFVDAAVSKAERDLAYEWGLAFYETGKFINEDDTTNKDNLKAVLNEYNTTIKNPLIKEYARGFKIENYDLYVDRTVDILNSIGVNVSKEDLNNVISTLGTDDQGNENKHAGLNTLINKTLSGIFGSEGILVTLSLNDLKEDQKPEEVLAKDNKIINFARLVITDNVYLIEDTVLGAENNTYYVYALPSLITSYVKELKKDSELFKGLTSVVYNKNSQYLKQIAEGKEFGLRTFASYRENEGTGVDYKKINDRQDFLLKFNSLYKGLIPLPTLADRKAYYFYKGLDKINLDDANLESGVYTISDRVIDIFEGYAEDEQSRIVKVKAEIAETKKTKDYSKLVLNKHYTKSNSKGVPVFDNSAQGLQYRHFTDFNIYDKDGNFVSTKPINKASIKKALRSNTMDTIEYAKKLGILQINRDKNGKIRSIEPGTIKDKKGNIVETLFVHPSLKKYTKEYGSQTTAIYHMMAEFTVNNIASVIETEKLVSGDPAYYKSVEDKIKRLNSIVAPGSKLIEKFTEGEFKDKPTYTSAIVKTFVYNDTKLISQLAPKFAIALRKQFPDATEKEISEGVALRLDPYKKVDVTDAQVYVTLAMYREMKIRMGEWEEDTHERAYRLLILDTKDKDELLKAQTLIMQPLKLIHFGQYFKDGAGIPVYDKMSVAVLLPDVVKGTLLEPLYDKMISDNIDMIKYDSAVKVGNTGSVDYFDKSGNPIAENLDYLSPFEQNFKYLRKQLDTDPHVTETRQLGTQVKKVVMQNLKLDERIYKIKGSNKKYIGREIGDMFSKAYATLSNRGREAVEKELGIDANNNIDKEKLYDNLRKAAEQSNQTYNVIDGILEGVQLDTLLNRGWTESRIISFITKNTIDAITSGTDLIQMSGGGLITSNSEQLQLLDSKGRTEIEVSVSLFKSIIPNYDGKTYNEKIKWLKKNWAVGFDGIGYRIPTQGQNSVIPFVIKKFLPESYGNTIILPYNFTSLTGSDFDIDKLYIAKYSYYTIGDNIHKYKFIEGNEEGIIEDEESLKQIWGAFVLPKIVRRDNLIELKEKIDKQADKKVALLNAWNNELATETKIDIAEELGIDTITQDVLDMVGVSMTYEKLKEYIAEANKYPDEAQFIKENKGKDAFEINHKKSVQNRLLDLMFSVLTNEDHILETKTPLDTFTKKLQDMAGTVKSKAPLSMLASASPAYQLQVKNWYIGGGKGIGPFALNNVHHALTQLTGYVVDGYDISGVMGRDGIAIVDWLSALINANVDIAKDPYIFHLNVHQGTYDMVNFLIRAGYGEQTFWFINQPFLKEFTDPFDIDIIEAKAVDEASKGANKQQLELRKKEIKDIIVNYLKPDVSLTDKNLKNYITQKDRDYKFYAKQAGIAIAYKDLNNSAKKLSTGVLNSRIDNKGFGNTIGALRKFDKDFNSLLETDDSFSNLIDQTFLKTLYSNSVPFIREIYSGLTIDSTTGFDEIVDSITPNYANIERDVVSAAVYSGVISSYFTSPKGYNLSKDDVSNLFKGKTSLGYRVRNLETRFPELVDNKLIKTLKPVYDIEDGIWFLKYVSGDKNDKFIRDSYSEAWGDLLEHTDKDVRKLGEDLMYYSFYTSGFNRSLYSFYQDLPINKLTERPDHSPKELTQSFDEFIKDMIVQLSSFTLSDEIKSTITKEAKKYLGGKSVPEYGAIPHAVASGNKIGLFKLDPTKIKKSGENRSGDPIFQNLYTVKYEGTTYTVEYVGYKTDSKEAVYRVIPSSGIDYKGHKIYELGYEGSIFEGKTAEVSDDVLENKLKNYKGFQDFIYVSSESKDILDAEEMALELKETVTPVKSNFKGYKGGFENKGKGTPQGDGKDKAMRKIADTSIVEIANRNRQSSSLTTEKALPWDSNKTIGGIVMLARNGSLFGTQLSHESKKRINEANERGANFVIGDMPNVDSQFIDYLQKIGAGFTIYHTGDYSRINIKETITPVEEVKEEVIEDGLTNVQRARLQTIPENLRSNKEIQNAALNMSKEEFNAIVEQIKKCN